LDIHKRNHHANQDADWVVDKKQKDKDARAKRVARQEHTCDICPSTFGAKQDLERHRLRFHADQNDLAVVALRNQTRKSGRDNKAKRKANDPVYRLSCSMKCGFHNWISRNGGNKGSRVEDVIGMSFPDLLSYLEKNSLDGLTYRDRNVQVDHVKPKNEIKKTGPVEQRELWSYLNLQLLTTADNCRKECSHDANAYAASDIGKEIAKLRVGWVQEFGETPGPEIIPNEEEDTVQDDEELHCGTTEDEFSDSDEDEEVDAAVETGNIESDHIENTEMGQVDVQAVETGDINMGQIEEKKPHQCDECVKTYKYKRDLDIHKRNHHADQDADWVVDKKQKDKDARAKRVARQEHTCDICPSTFGAKQDLERHRLRFHTDQNDLAVVALRNQMNKNRRKNH
jgi:hypothetical protein